MVLSSKFTETRSNGGMSALLGASLDFAVAPNEDNKARLTDAYGTTKPAHMGSLNDYFAKHAAASTETLSAKPAVTAAKKMTTGSGF